MHENSKIGEDAADDIAAALSSNPKLHVLDFNDNNLQTTGMIKISKALQKISLLTELYFKSNNIDEAAANDIAAALSNNTKLLALDLSCNKLCSSWHYKDYKCVTK